MAREMHAVGVSELLSWVEENVLDVCSRVA
jgi:hypothetical protein